MNSICGKLHTHKKGIKTVCVDLVCLFNDVISFLVDWLGATPMGVQLQSHKDHWSLCCSRAFIRFVKTNKAYDLIVARYKLTPTVFGEQGCSPLPMGELEQGCWMFGYAICVMYMYVGKQKHENDGWFNDFCCFFAIQSNDKFKHRLTVLHLWKCFFGWEYEERALYMRMDWNKTLAKTVSECK